MGFDRTDAARRAGRRIRRMAGAALAAALIAVASQATAASWLEKNVYLTGPRFDGLIPACDEPAALADIQRRFALKEREFWNSNVEIVAFDRIRQVAFRPWAAGTVPRRFCRGRVQTSDGRWRNVRYSIIEDGGLISATWGVEWCVVGFDHNHAYSPACRAAGP